MALAIQLDFFDNPPQEITVLREEVKATTKMCNNVRRGIFARHDELSKLFLQQKKEYDELKDKFKELEKKLNHYLEVR